MRWKCRIAVLVALALSPQTTTLQGQTVTATDDRPPGWILTPAIGVGGLWDDNVLLQHPNAEKPGDYSSPINPSIKIDFTGRRTSLSTGYDGSIVLHRTLEELNSYQQSLRARLEHRPTKRLLLHVDESFTASPTTDALELGGVPFYRIGSRSNSLSGGVEALLTSRTTLRGTYGLTSVAFDKDERQLLDLLGGNAHEVTAALEHAVSKVLTVGAEYNFVRAIIAGAARRLVSPDPLLEGDDRFNIQAGGVTASYVLTPIWAIHGGAGISRLSGGLFQEPRTGPTVRAGVIRRGRRSIVTGEYGRSYIPAFGFGGTSQNEELTGSVKVPLARNRVFVEASASLLDNDALEPGRPSLRSTWLNGRVAYYATRWLRIEGYYGRAYQDSHLEGGKRNRNTIGFQVVTSKPFKVK